MRWRVDVLSPDDERFLRLFAEFRYTAYRFEALQNYTVIDETGAFRQFLAGEARGDFPAIQAWIDDTILNAVKQRKLVHRVHVVEEPLSDYVRFECAWAYHHTVAAGEEVRILPVPKGAWPAELPRSDYWLFDSSTLVEMQYEDGALHSVRIVEELDKILLANYWRDIAVMRSVSYRQFASEFDPRFRRIAESAGKGSRRGRIQWQQAAV